VTRFDQYEYAKLSDVGVRRSHNQDNDAVLSAADQEQWQQRGHLFVVADGMGAHAVGEKASEQAASVIPHTYSKHAVQGPITALRKAFIEANAHIHAFGQANREFEGTGTTATALLVRPEGAWIGHVGDSRCYRIRDGVIDQLSYDHSLVWEYARLKRIDPEDVEDIPSNVIHRCLGPEPAVQVDIEGPHLLHGDDIFLLCSDGLSGQLTDHEIGAVATALPPAEACRFLVDLANLRGGPDNITVIIVRITGSPDANGAAPPPTPRPRRRWPNVPWWLPTLGAGTILVGLASYLQVNRMEGAMPSFALASIAIFAGLIGLLMHYRQEQLKQEDEEETEAPPQPRIHRSGPCRIEAGLLDRLAKAVEVLKQRADESHWEPDAEEYAKHRDLAVKLAQERDLTGAFREYCRAMLPLSQALSKHRRKEEVFQPVWDKTPRNRSAPSPTPELPEPESLPEPPPEESGEAKA
jgi:protein phosphatase